MLGLMKNLGCWCVYIKSNVSLQEAGVRRQYDQRLRVEQRLDGQSGIGRVHQRGSIETHHATGSIERHPNNGGEVRRGSDRGKTRGCVRGVHKQGKKRFSHISYSSVERASRINSNFNLEVIVNIYLLPREIKLLIDEHKVR